MIKPVIISVLILALFAPVFDTEAGTIKERFESSILSLDDDLNSGFYFQEDFSDSGGKSKWKALGLSLLVPGAGQYYAENNVKMKIFGSAEALIWSGFFGFRAYGGWRKEDYKSWAAFHAGADVNGKSDDFFEKLTYYDTRDYYNQLQRLYEGSRAVLFPETDEYYWNWDTFESRDHYRDLRNKSKNAYRRSLLFLGFAVANRLISAIDAYRSAGSANEFDEFSESGWKAYYSANTFSGENGFEVGLSLHF